MLSEGFEIETEMSVHALELRMPVGEVETSYARGRKDRSRSSPPIRTAGGSSRRLRTLYRVERPALFYGSDRSLLLVVAAIVLAIPLVVTYVQTGLVPRFPTAILVTGMTIIAVLCFFAGLILDTVTRGRREVRRLAYLSLSAPGTL